MNVKYNKQIEMTEEKLKQYLAEKRTAARSAAGQSDVSPFKVPDGYFDTLCDSIMDKLPTVEVTKKPRMVLLRKRFWQHAAATIFAVTAISLALYESSTNEKPSTITSASITEDIIHSYEDDNYVDEALDYAMIDNSEIAAYLTGY